MNEAQVEALKLITLPDEDYFSVDAKALGALQGRLAALLGPKGGKLPPPGQKQPLAEMLLISAPATLDLEKRSSFPALVAAVRSGQRSWEVDPEQNRLFVLSNLATGAVDVMAAFPPGRRKPVYPPSRSGEPPDAVNAAAGAAGVRSFDLLNWFSRDTVPGRNAVTLIEYDRRSNTAFVNVAAGKGAKRRSFQRLRAQPAASPASPGSASGVEFSAPSSLAGAAAPLQGTLRLPRAEVTAVDAPPGSPQPLLVAGALVLVKLDDSKPQLVHLVLPARAATPAGGVAAVESAFSVDLRAALAPYKLSGTYLAYLVVGAAVSGPQAITAASP
jgi:hypothetical protein